MTTPGSPAPEDRLTPTLPPAEIALKLRLACPCCAGTVTRERLADGPGGRKRIKAECAYCERYRQVVEVPAPGSPGPARTIPWPPVMDGKADPTDRYGSLACMPPTIKRPRCRMGGCRRNADEGGLCRPHLTAWQRAGRPDREAWIARENQRLSSVKRIPRARYKPQTGSKE